MPRSITAWPLTSIPTIQSHTIRSASSTGLPAISPAWKNAPLISEGIESLNKAIQLRPDYDDAMAYLNLMYREKADVECDDLAARQEDLKTADHWVDQTLLTKKAKAEKQPGAQGITMDQPK